MIFDNKYFLGNIGWLPERMTWGASILFFPKPERERPKYSIIISYAYFEFAWCGWRRWPYINLARDSRY